MKKKLVATVLAGVMALSVAMTGCGSSSDTADGTFTPTKSIQWMCTSSAGGGSDIFTRMIGDIMTTNGMVNDQTIVVTNKTDGAGEVGRNEILIESPIKALWFVIFVLALQQLDGNVIGPKILGDRTGLSSFWVLFTIILFGGLWGVFGMVIGVPLFAVIYDTVKKLVRRGLDRKGQIEIWEQYKADYPDEEPKKT